MTTLREAAQQAQQALEALAYIDSGYWHDFVEGPIAALRTALAEQPAEQESVRGEWQGYTWNPYAVSQPKAEPLTDEEIYECERIAAIRYHRHKSSIRGQQITPADDPQWHFANAIIDAYERKNGVQP